MERYTSLTKERLLNFKARINEASVVKILTFLNSDGSGHDISALGFEIPVYKSELSTTPIFTLTVGDGLTVQGDDDHQLAIELSALRATQRYGTYFVRLYSSTEYHTWLSGDWEFINGKFDGVVETDSITIYENGGDVTITIESGGGDVTLASLGETLETAADDTPLGPDTFHFWDFVDGILKKVSWTNLIGILDALYDSAGSAAAALVSANAYTDSQVVGLWDDRGNFNASVNAYPSSGGSGTAGAILKGDIWTVSVGGTLPTGIVVFAGDTVRALVDTPGNTQANWAVAENNIGYVPENQANKATGFGTVNDTLYPTVEAVTEYAVAITNTAVALTDGASITLTATKHTLTTDEATITFTDSYAGDFLGIEVTLSGITGATWTLPANSLGAYNGVATGTNNIVVSGAVSGDKIIVSRWKCGSNYYYVAFNFGQ